MSHQESQEKRNKLSKTNEHMDDLLAAAQEHQNLDVAWRIVDMLMSDESAATDDCSSAAQTLERYGDLAIRYFAARLWWKAGRKDRALENYLDLCDHDFPPALWCAGRLHIHSDIVVNDGRYEKGIHLLRRAVKGGHLFAGRSLMIALARQSSIIFRPWYFLRLAIYSIRGVWRKEVRGIYDETVM